MVYGFVATLVDVIAAQQNIRVHLNIERYSSFLNWPCQRCVLFECSCIMIISSLHSALLVFSTFENEILSYNPPSLINHTRSPAGSPHDSPTASPGMFTILCFCRIFTTFLEVHSYVVFMRVCQYFNF